MRSEHSLDSPAALSPASCLSQAPAAALVLFMGTCIALLWSSSPATASSHVLSSTSALWPGALVPLVKIPLVLPFCNQGFMKTSSSDDGTAHGTGGSDDHIYRGDIYMVFEYMDHDLKKVLHHSIPSQVKIYMRQLLKGLHYCHINNILHRDIKG
ncbi:hypothetical protein PR202_gb03007 [Eleusine coracana subsp. coracana]|uniref:[RNA-polymerase]-subunit kinase n=1 Tax=Eleusine coracana subsp. coracana TaxID=191504 RepID=A0AAV5E016_ELECO|nr:hypothetical protein PR202_gb03007 [Eleusine coracana subsp. coracana]